MAKLNKLTISHQLNKLIITSQLNAELNLRSSLRDNTHQKLPEIISRLWFLFSSIFFQINRCLRYMSIFVCWKCFSYFSYFHKNLSKAFHSKVSAKQSWNEEPAPFRMNPFVMIANSLKLMTIVIRSSIINMADFVTSFCLFLSILVQSHLRTVWKNYQFQVIKNSLVSPPITLRFVKASVSTTQLN